MITNRDAMFWYCNTKFLQANCWRFELQILRVRYMLKWIEEFEDTKGAIIIHISKKNRQHNGQKKKNRQHNGQKKKNLFNLSPIISFHQKEINLMLTVIFSLVLYVCFVDRCLSLCTFSFGHCVVCSSSIYPDATKLLFDALDQHTDKWNLTPCCKILHLKSTAGCQMSTSIFVGWGLYKYPVYNFQRQSSSPLWEVLMHDLWILKFREWRCYF
jgi:hypothetical protein